jgi:glycosyltransferase involved in cell wall biosynthesis
MNILYDGEIYATYSKQVGGISRYFDNLISRLPENFYPILTTARDRNGSHPTHPNLELHRYDFNFRPRDISRILRNKYFQLISGRFKPQITHPTYYLLMTGRAISEYKCPTVITVYDMIHEVFADSIDPNRQISELKRKAIFSAQSILCISENTKRDLLERYPALESRVTVTLLATELNKSYIHENTIVPSCPYYLYVGSREGYKNFDRLLIAFTKVITKFPDLVLCVVGSSLNKAEKKRITELNLSKHIKYYGSASDSQLAKLYNSSIALVYPSLYEGFGIPPLEAISCGTAVIASNTSSIPEVVGGGGLLFDPTSTDELVDRLLLLLDNSSERDFLLEKGRNQIKKFSWEKTTSETVNVYNSLI